MSVTVVFSFLCPAERFVFVQVVAAGVLCPSRGAVRICVRQVFLMTVTSDE